MVIQKRDKSEYFVFILTDKWRAYSYQKAITTIRRCTKRIDSFEVKFDEQKR